MSQDNLLRTLGRLSARQADEDRRPLPPGLTGPPALETRQRLAEQALAALHGSPARPPGWIQRLYARRTLLLATPVLGAAAAGLLLARGRTTAVLPAYTLQLTGGVSAVRAAAPVAGPLELTDGSRVELLLRPAQTIAGGGLQVRLSWARDGRELPWTAATEISEQGAVRITGTAPRPFGPGAGELVVQVGRAGVWQTLRAPVRWR